MADRTVLVRLRAEIGEYQANLRKAQQATAEFGREITGAGKTAKADLDQIGRGALVMASGLAVGLGLSAKAAIDWESAWAGVTKTVDGSASEMADLEQGLRNLAKELPATHGEIAAVAEAAGQLGIKRSAIEGFTRTMIDLGETTNLTADQAATSMARMANIMQTPQADIERMASTLVALGNAGASTESEILDMAMRIAGSAKQVGITEAATLGFANALSSVGIEAEAGGTAISRVFSTIASSVADGGEGLDEFARIAGMSSAEFSTAFREDAAGATIAFIEGLDRIKGSGENVFAVLQNLELGDIRVRDALLRAAGAGDLFRESLALGADEWERNMALTTEAEKRYDTTAAKLEIARNNVTDLAINIGGALLPVLGEAAAGASSMAQGFGELPGPLQAVAQGMGGLVLVVSGGVAAASLLGPKIMVVHAALMKMGAAGRFAAGAMPWLAAAAAAIATVSYVFGENAKKAEEAEERIKGYTDAIREAGSVAEGAEARLASMAQENADLARIFDQSGLSLTQWADALSGSDADFQSFIAGLREAEAGGADFGMSAGVMAEALANARGEIQQGAVNAEILGRVLPEVGDAASGASGGVGELAGGLTEAETEAKEAEEAFRNLIDAYRGAVDPLFGMLDAVDANRTAQANLAEALALNTDGIADNEKSAEELDAMYREVASSAMDVEVAARELTNAIATGNVDLETANAMLGEWVANGSLTEEQAIRVAAQFKNAADQGAAIAPEYKTKVTADTTDAERKLRTIKILMGEIEDTSQRAPETYAGPSYRRAQGGLIPHLAGGGFPGGPSGTDTIPAWLSPGEFVMRSSAVDKFGVGFMESLNRGQLTTGSGGGSSVVFAPVIGVTVAPGSDGRREGDALVGALSAWCRDNGVLPRLITGVP